MTRNFLNIIWRRLLKDKLSTFLNLIGLSTGLACTIFIYLWITDELGVDKFHEKDDQLYQVMKNQANGNVTRTVEWTPAPLGAALLAEMPEVLEATTVMPSSIFPESVVSLSGQGRLKAKPQFASKSFFEIFSFKLIIGNRSQVLSDKNAIVISEDLAERLFHSPENSIGKTIDWQILEWKGQSVVSGVFKDVPSNSTQQFDFVLTFEAFLDLPPRFKNNCLASSPSTYLILKENSDATGFTGKIAGFVKSKNKESNVNLFVRKYSDQYLHGIYQQGVQAGGRISYVRLFTVIAIFILVIACINFTNLSTARATKRMKEIGIRKTMGSGRRLLVLQYLGESVLLALLSLLLAVLLILFFMPLFNEVTGKNISFPLNLNFIFICFAITLLTGLVAGSYPALYLSAFNPVAILKGKIKSSAREQWMRKGLVIFQFTVSVVMIVSVVVVYQQMEFVHSKNLGYNKENVIYFQPEVSNMENMNTFISGIKNIHGIANASSTTHPLKGSFMTTSNLSWPGKKNGDEISFERLVVNNELIETLGMQLQIGRSFSRTYGGEADKIILNEAAIEVMGMADPLGKMIELGDDKKQIIGVVKNFHFESLHQNIKPLYFVLNNKAARIIVAKIESGNEQAAIADLRKYYDDFHPGYSFDYKFLNDEYQALYVAEQQISLLSRFFAGLIILISCLGLFGLAAFTAEKRQKEIGIRKVVGASPASIMILLCKDFLKLITLACLVAFPLSWWVMNDWLEGFAYRVTVNPFVFLIAGLSVMVITLLTISFQAIKATITNPVISLRME